MTRRRSKASTAEALGALADAISTTGSGHVRIRQLCELKPSPENDELYKPVNRDDPAVIDLADSIRTHGFVGAIVVSLDDYILSGHRRAVAATLAGLVEVPTIVDPIYRRDPSDPFVTNPLFIQKLEAYNRQREKTLDELLRESIVKSDPIEAHRALSAYRSARASDFDTETVELRGYKHRARISRAKMPFALAVKRIVDRMRKDWPLTDREIHYELLNDPPLRHASKPDSTYNNTSPLCLNPRDCELEHRPNGKHLNNGADCWKDLTDLLTRMRLFGLIPWTSIDDPTRPISITQCWPNVGPYLTEQIDGFLKGYYRDLMQSQPNHIEIMYEKTAGAATVRSVAVEHCIPLTVGRGFSSIPPRYQIAQRYKKSGKEKLIILAMSDLDPDGDEIAHSFARSLRDDFDIEQVELVKVALTMDQARERNLPESAFDRAKPGSANYRKYVERYGTDAIWELSALPRDDQRRLLVEAIESVLDVRAYNHEVRREQGEAAFLNDRRQLALTAIGDVTTWQTDDDEG